MRELTNTLLYDIEGHVRTPVGVVKNFGWNCDEEWAVSWYALEDLDLQRSWGRVSECMTEKEIVPLIISEQHPIFEWYPLPYNWFSSEEETQIHDWMEEIAMLCDDRVHESQVRDIAKKIVRTIREARK